MPSPSAVEDCTRRVWAIATGVPRTEPVPASTVLAMEQGRSQEGIAAQILEGMGCEIVAEQLPIDAESIGCVEGTIDFLIETPPVDGFTRLIVVDAKRMNMYRYSDLVYKGVFAAHNPYYTQLQLYMHSTGTKLGWILAMAADYSALKGNRRWSRADLPPPVWIEEVEYNDAWAERSINRAKDQAHYIKETRDMALVPKDFDPKSRDWQCNYCGFKKACLEAG